MNKSLSAMPSPLSLLMTLILVLISNQISGSATAQVSFGGNLPIDVKANRATYRGSKTVLSGGVSVSQDGATIYADRMDLFRAETITQGAEESADIVKLGNINRIVATGNFKYETSENRVTGDKGVYERDKDIITVTGNAKFVQDNGNTVSGNSMVYDLKTNKAKIDGNCTGRDCKTDDRVKINISNAK